MHMGLFVYTWILISVGFLFGFGSAVWLARRHARQYRSIDRRRGHKLGG